MFKPGQPWLDTDGKLIQAHGGGILHHDGTYYWYGENKDAPNTGSSHRVDVIGINCYASQDLENWKYQGLVLEAEPEDLLHDLHPRNVLERPKVLFNLETNKFVLWAHVDDPTYKKACTGVAISESPTGPFTYLGSFQPCGRESRDMTVWQDPDDGVAYLIHSSDGNATMHIVRLAGNYLEPCGKYVQAFQNEFREAPAVWKHRDRYYMITSGCTGWNCNPARWHSAPSMMGPWTTGGDPVEGCGVDKNTTFQSQSTYVLPVPGREDAFIFCADRWQAHHLRESGYVWLPMWMTPDGPRIEWHDEWDFSVFD